VFNLPKTRLQGFSGLLLVRTGRHLKVRFGSKCEELRVSKVSPLYSTKRTSMKGVATSLMGQGLTHPMQQTALLLDHLIDIRITRLRSRHW